MSTGSEDVAAASGSGSGSATHVAAAATIFLTSVVGTLAARRLSNGATETVLSVANCFGGGVFLAAGFIHLLADAVVDTAPTAAPGAAAAAAAAAAGAAGPLAAAYADVDTACMLAQLQLPRRSLPPMPPAKNCSLNYAVELIRTQQLLLLQLSDAGGGWEPGSDRGSGGGNVGDDNDAGYPWVFFFAALGVLATLCTEQVVQALVRSHTASSRLRQDGGGLTLLGVAGSSSSSSSSSSGGGGAGSGNDGSGSEDDDGNRGDGGERGLVDEHTGLWSGPFASVALTAADEEAGHTHHRAVSTARHHHHPHHHHTSDHVHSHGHGFAAIVAAVTGGASGGAGGGTGGPVGAAGPGTVATSAPSIMLGGNSHTSTGSGGDDGGGTSGFTGSAVLLVALSAHSLLAGLALGVEDDIWATFLAIIAHKGIETFALATALMRSGVSATVFVNMTLAFALVTPTAVVVGTVLRAMGGEGGDHSGSGEAVWIPYLVAFSSGMFVYIGLVEILAHELANPRDGAHGPKTDNAKVLAAVAGWLATAVLGVWT